jgi:maltooligosyltrehalose trehalohydrolase
VANSAFGPRIHTVSSPGRHRALTALTLLGPATPLLFQGQEFAASSPWVYFADHHADLARRVREGRSDFLKQFRSLATPDMAACLADPGDPATFASCKLDMSERDSHAEAYALHRDLLRIRREDPVLRAQRTGWVDGAVIGPEALVLRFFGDQADDRLLIVNLGRDLDLRPVPEPLLAPPAGKDWELLWTSEDPRYGGCSTAPIEENGTWRIPGHAAIVLGPKGIGNRD